MDHIACQPSRRIDSPHCGPSLRARSIVATVAGTQTRPMQISGLFRGRSPPLGPATRIAALLFGNAAAAHGVRSRITDTSRASAQQP